MKVFSTNIASMIIKCKINSLLTRTYPDCVKLASAFTRCLSSTSGSQASKPDIKSKIRWKFELGELSVGGSGQTGFPLKLNNIIMKTPMKNPFLVPSEILGIAILEEWKSNTGNKRKIDLPTMNLTTLAYEAIDNPFEESKESIKNDIIEYLKFDTIRFRTVENEELLSSQSRHWDPLVGWFEHQYQCHLPIDYGDLANQTTVPDQCLNIISKLIMSHSRWPLVGIRFMSQNLKSFILSSCLMSRFLQADQAVDLSRLETKHQTEKWSKVEWEHDLDEQSICARVAAASLFYHLTNNQQIDHKTCKD